MMLNIHNITRPGCYILRLYSPNMRPHSYIESAGVDQSTPDIDLFTAFLSLSMVTQLYGSGQRVLMHINNSDMFATLVSPSQLKQATSGSNRHAWTRLEQHRTLHEVNWVVMDPQDQFIKDTQHLLDRLEHVRDNPPDWMR